MERHKGNPVVFARRSEDYPPESVAESFREAGWRELPGIKDASHAFEDATLHTSKVDGLFGKGYCRIDVKDGKTIVTCQGDPHFSHSPAKEEATERTIKRFEADVLPKILKRSQERKLHPAP
jgi:hypothetical protein